MVTLLSIFFNGIAIAILVTFIYFIVSFVLSIFDTKDLVTCENCNLQLDKSSLIDGKCPVCKCTSGEKIDNLIEDCCNSGTDTGCSCK